MAVASMNSIDEDEQRGPTFITVLFGDNQKAIFNPRCKVDIFMEHIRRKCCLLEKSGTIDLVDLEGEVKHLSSRSRDFLYASEQVPSRQSYVLVKVEKQGDRDPVKYVPLLKNLEEINPELYEKLNNMQVKQQGPTTPRLSKKDTANLHKHNAKRQLSISKTGSKGTDSRRGSRKN